MYNCIKIVPFVLLLVYTFSCTRQQPDSIPGFSSKGVEMVAHKGVHFDSIAPPNSIDAILLAHRAGFKTIEIDLNRTKDNEVILLHDNHLHETFRLSDGYKAVDTGDSVTYCVNLTLEEMRKNFVFASPDPAMRRPVVTYKEALQLMKSLGLFPYLEFKQMSFEDRLDLVYEAIDEALKVLGKDNFIVTCWGQYVCENIRRKYPHLVVCCDPVQDYDILAKNRFSYFPYWEKIDQEIINRQHRDGYTISTWTVDRAVFDSVAGYNVDKILTDNIAPQFDKANAVFNDYSDGKFVNYTFDGELKDNIVRLKKGDVMELKDAGIPSVYFGAMHFGVELKGRFEIESAGNFVVERENFSDDFKLFSFQYMIHNKRPDFKITALEETKVKSIWYAVSRY